MAFLLLLLLLCVKVHRAAIIELNPGESISEAIRSSAAGDTLLLNDGVYFESVRVLNHSVVLASRFILDADTSHISGTVIDAHAAVADTQSCVVSSLPTTDSLSLLGLTLRNGHGTIWHTDDVNYIAGGAIHVTQGRISIRNCCIEASGAEWGGGVFCITENQSPDEIQIELRYSRITNCRAEYYGGGAVIRTGAASLEFVTFEACTSNGTGGGLTNLSTSTTLLSCTLRSCAASLAAVEISGANSIVQGCVFEGNGNHRSREFFGTCHLISAGAVYVRNNVFRNNTTNDPAIWIHDFRRFGQPFFTGNIIESHTMTDRIGSVYFWNCEGEVCYNIVRDCYGERGAPLFPQGSIRFHHNVFRDNRKETTDPNYASVIDLTNAQGSSVRMDSNLIQGNSSPVIAYDPLVPLPSTVIARHNFWGHETGPYHYNLNPNGQGDTIYINNIEFEPWLTSPPDTAHSDVTDNQGRPSIPATWQILSVYPNPFNSTLRIDLAGFARDDFKIALFDLLGRECAVLHVGSTSGGSLLFPAPATLASGIYFLMTRDAHYSVANKVVFLK